MQRIEEQIALTKYKLIAPVIGDPSISQKEYFLKLAESAHRIPGREETVKYRACTFKKWLKLFRKHGLDGLVPHRRNDRGTFRSLTVEHLKKLEKIAQEYEFRTTKAFYAYAAGEQVFSREHCSYATFNAFARHHRLLEILDKKKRKSFEKPSPNMLWTGDIMYGPHVYGGRHGQRSYLVTLIDDHSRFPVGARFCIGQDFESVDRVLREALATYGIPAALYFDHGKVFISDRLVRAGIKLGFTVVHPPVGDPAPRGKIERFFRTVRDMFLDIYLATLKGKRPTIEELDAAFQEWLRGGYLHRVHGTTKISPHDRFMAGLATITIRRKSAEDIRRAFLRSFERKVSKDALVSIDNQQFEVPGEYIGQRIMVLMEQGNLETALIDDPKEKKHIVIRPVDRAANSILPPFRFSKNKIVEK